MRRSALVSDLFTGVDQEQHSKSRLTYKGKDEPLQVGTDVHRISIPELTNILTKLRKYSDVRMGDLPDEIAIDLNNFKELADVVAETSFYTDIVKIMNNIFGDIKDIKADTVGAFFQGCSTQNNYPGPQSCSPICAGMMPPPHDVSGWSFCDQSVIYFDGEKLSFQHITQDRPDRAIIHVITPSNYTGFTPYHIKQLEASGIKSVSLHILGDNGRYIEKLNSQPITSLPLKSDSNSARSSTQPKPKPTPKPDHHDSDTDNTWLWILLIIGVFLLICFLVWWSRKNTKVDDTYYGKTTTSYSNYRM